MCIRQTQQMACGHYNSYTAPIIPCAEAKKRGQHCRKLDLHGNVPQSYQVCRDCAYKGTDVGKLRGNRRGELGVFFLLVLFILGREIGEGNTGDLVKRADWWVL
jgi:hypothetical protein